VLLPHPAGPVTIRMWWWLDIDIGAVFSVFSIWMIDDCFNGEPVLEVGGVGGGAYCIGFGCVWSTLCIIVVR
jgi:hypothetical protein